MLGDFDPARYTTYREWAVAPDGTRVPISVVHRRDLDAPGTVRPLRLRRLRDQHRPVLLAPPPLAARPGRRLRHRPRARRRARWAGPGTRTGGWSTRPTRSRTSSPARATSSTPGIARPGALAGRGGSAGGLLIGAVANQAPELFRALVARGALRRLRHHHARRRAPADGRRMGGVGQPPGRRGGLPPHAHLLPLRQRDGRRTRTARRAPIRTSSSPAGLNDPRVAYWEPAKWVAKLRAPSPTTRVLLRTELGAGHGGPSGRYDAWKEEALVLAFLLDALGLVAAGPGTRTARRAPTTPADLGVNAPVEIERDPVRRGRPPQTGGWTKAKTVCPPGRRGRGRDGPCSRTA